MLADPRVARWLGDGFPMTSREAAWRHLAMLAGHWTLRGYGHWAVEVKATGEFAGRVGTWYPEGWPDVEVGWVLAADHWGKGYAPEAGAEALRQAFATLGLDHVISLILPGNTASIRVAEKLGARLERRMMFHNLDTLIYMHTSPEGAPTGGGEVTAT